MRSYERREYSERRFKMTIILKGLFKEWRGNTQILLILLIPFDARAAIAASVTSGELSGKVPIYVNQTIKPLA